MAKNTTQRGTIHHCTAVRGTESVKGKTYKKFQGMRSNREGSPCCSRQRAEKTSLAGVHLYIRKHKTNLGSFEGHVSLNHSTILIMTMTIKCQPLATQIFPSK
jgi:hypothetical protein